MNTIKAPGVTVEEIRDALRSIDWDLRAHSPGPSHWRPRNHMGEVTAWCIHNGEIRDDTWGESRAFWGTNASQHGATGRVSFQLKALTLDVLNDAVFLYIGGDAACISFYNHTRPHGPLQPKEATDGGS